MITAEEKERYSRQLLIPEWGEEAQEKLKAAKVLIIGAGGLGSPASLYLTAGGVGTIGIVDGDAQWTDPTFSDRFSTGPGIWGSPRWNPPRKPFGI